MLPAPRPRRGCQNPLAHTFQHAPSLTLVRDSTTLARRSASKSRKRGVPFTVPLPITRSADELRRAQGSVQGGMEGHEDCLGAEKGDGGEVYTIAGEQYSWTPATVKTLLKRLVDKGYVSTTPVGNGFVYRPAQTALATLQAAADMLLTNAVEEATGPLLVHMVERTSLSEADLDSLQKLIDAQETGDQER